MNKCKIEWVDKNRVKVIGIIDEFSSFESLFSSAADPLHIDFSEVTRINSSGIREWVQGVLSSTSTLILERCSSVMVDQLSMIPEFIGRNGEVRSFFVHYVCDSCSKEQQELVEVTPQLNVARLESPETSCKSCGGKLSIDHNPDIYFSFLRNFTSAS